MQNPNKIHMSIDQQTPQMRRESSRGQIASFGSFSLPNICSPYSFLVSTDFAKFSFIAHVSLSLQPEYVLPAHPFLSR